MLDTHAHVSGWFKATAFPLFLWNSACMLHNLTVQVWCATLSINCYLNRESHQQFAGLPASPMTNIYNHSKKNS